MVDNVLHKKLYQILLEFKVGSSVYMRYADELFYLDTNDQLLKQKIAFYNEEKSKVGNQIVGEPALINYYIVTTNLPIVEDLLKI